MSTVETLTRNYEAFSLGNPEPLLNSLSDEIQWRVSGGSPLAGEYRGKGEVMGFFGRMMELYEGTMRLQVVDVLGNGQRGVVLTEERCAYRGRPLTFSSVHLWKADQGKFTGFDVQYDDAYHRFWAT